MAQVLIVSNRLPVSVSKENGELVFSRSIGGLATGLAPYASDRHNTWIGWPGIASDELTEADKQTIITELAKQGCSPVFLSQRQIDDFYTGYSNGVLWPLLHELPSGSSARHKQWWQGYRAVNQHFAEAIFSLAQTGSNIWIHDYLLMLVPELVRAGRPDLSLGFFLHTPFPPAKKFTRLSEAKKLVNGLLGAELVGMQTKNHVANFVETCRAYGFEVSEQNQVTVYNRIVRVADFPIGIDYQKFVGARNLPAVKQAVKRYKRKYRGMKVIATADRLDISKGFVERLKAYQEFLQQHPEIHGKVVLALVGAPSRTNVPAYQRLASQVDALVRQINLKFGSHKWQPVDYINVTIPFEEVVALFEVADVAFVTPLSDGMNLTAKEFVASSRKNGVLILSETAGVSQELHDALIINPKKPASAVAALQQALTMPKRELRHRLRAMQQQISGNTVQDWASKFVLALQQPVPGTQLTRTLSEKFSAALVADYRQAKKRLLLFDYDGSLVYFTKDYTESQPPKSLLKLLEKVLGDERNDVVIVSGRSADDLQKWLGHLRLNLVAEHGAAIKKLGHHWQTSERAEARWKRAVEPVLQKYADLTPGAMVETKPHSLVWHYRASPPYYAQKYAVTIKRVLKPFLKTYGLEIFQGNKILEIKDPKISKGNAVQSWLKQHYDFVLAIGDDYTDEDMFSSLPLEAYSIKVGSGHSVAKYRLKTPEHVAGLLKQLVS